LFEDKRLNKWSNSYWNHIKRNIGLVKISEQEKIRKTPVAILGIGGLGGPLVEQLIRSGCEQLIICDKDKFKESNLNRQLCTREDIGKFKVDVVENFLEKINPEIELRKYYEVNEKNISEILKNISIVVLTLDDPIVSIMISRECLKKNIPMLESWGIPYLWAWWFTSESINYETCYKFNTQEMSIKEIKESDKTLLYIEKTLLSQIIRLPGLPEIYDRESGAIEGMISKKLGLICLAPIVRLIASYLAIEVIFSGILKIKKMILAPNIIGYDYLRMKPIKFNFL